MRCIYKTAKNCGCPLLLYNEHKLNYYEHTFQITETFHVVADNGELLKVLNSFCLGNFPTEAIKFRQKHTTI